MFRSAHTPIFPTLALTGALALAGVIAPAEQALAGLAAPNWSQASHVSDVVTNNGDGTWTYNYTVHNDSTSDSTFYGGVDSVPPEPVIVDWELPYFNDAGITNIISPSRWSYAIETIGQPNPTTGWEGVAAWQNPSDPFYTPNSPFNLVTQVLHWYSNCWVNPNLTGCDTQLRDAILPGGSLSGFGFTASFDKTNSPYQASWAEQPIQTGDPDFPGGVPNSPSLRQTSVPEPGVLALLGAGVVGLAALRRRRTGGGMA